MKILVAFDFSPAALRALAWAADFQRAHGATLHVVYAMNPVPPIIAALPAPPPFEPTNVTRFETSLQEAVTAAGATATCEVTLTTIIGDALVDAARAQKADLVVVGTHGRDGLARVLLGSVAEHLVRHAPCPVVTVRAPA